MCQQNKATMIHDSDFTHILEIKIIHYSDNNIVRNKDLLRQVKRYLIGRSNPQMITWNENTEDICLSWKKKKWDFPYNKFIGDLVVNSPYIVDYIVQEHTSKTIRYILRDLREKYIYWNDFDIIFNISKPLAISLPLATR